MRPALNYRPISFTSIFCKMLGRAIIAYVWEYLNDNEVLTSNQFSFRAGRSTADQLLLVYDNVSGATDEGKLLMLFSSTSAKHGLPQNSAGETEMHGLRPRLPRSHSGSCRRQPPELDPLVPHRQIHECAGEWSAQNSPRPVRSSALQGSALGLVLFLIFINSIAFNLSSS